MPGLYYLAGMGEGDGWDVSGSVANRRSVTADELLFRRRTSDCLDLSYLGVS